MNRIVICMLFVCSLASNSEGYEASILRPMDVFELEYASDPQISPNERRVVYVRNSMDVMIDRVRSRLWVIDVDGAGHQPATDVVEFNQISPRWSPHGSRLAYVAKEADEAPSQIFLRWMRSGETTRLAQLQKSPSHLTWSSDGKWLAFTMMVIDVPKPFIEMPKPPEGAKWAEPAKVIQRTRYRHDGDGYLEHGFEHVFLISADGGTPKQLTSGNFHHRGPLSWSSDDSSILFSSVRTDDWEHRRGKSDVYRVTIADGSITQLTKRDGPDDSPTVSPGGSGIAIVGYNDQKLSHHNYVLGIINQSGERRDLTIGLDRSISAPPVWDHDGTGLLIQYDDLGTTKIARVGLDCKTAIVASDVGGVTIGRPYASGSFSVAKKTIAFTATSPHRPSDVAVVDQRDGVTRRLTDLNSDSLGNRLLGDVDEYWFASSLDQRRIQSWLVKPPGFDPSKKYPMILEIHGGPFANYGPRFSMELQLYAAAGYLVLYVNPRGSTSYGQNFANLIHHNYPGPDYDDLMSGVDAVIAEGFADSNNLFVTGGSGGGILTAWIVGRTDRFNAAVSQKPVTNWYSFNLTTDEYPYFNQYWFPGPPWEHQEHYLKRSPIHQVGDVKTPTMLLTGEEDYRTPITQSEEFYQALRLRKIDSMLVRIPGASHAIVKRPSRMIAKVKHVLKRFERYRK